MSAYVNLVTAPSFPMLTSNLHTDLSPSLPPWLATSTSTASSSPSVTLTLSPLPPPPPILWLHAPDRLPDNPSHAIGIGSDNVLLSELVECCRELEEGHRAWCAHKKEAAWRLKRVELQLESEKASRKREKIEDIEAKVKALREEQRATLELIEAEYREQLGGLRREAEMKEQKLAEQWAAKHLRLVKFVEQVGCCSLQPTAEPNAR